jgi:plasmid rolling circle replication initiator protein Rep
MSEQEIAIIIQSLRKAIERDKNYFVKAKIDKSFDSIRSEVNTLLEEILQETKVKAEHAILKSESKIQIMKKWFNGDWCDEYSLKEYTLAREKIREAKGMFKTGSYFGYLAAIKAVQNAGEKLAIAQNSIREDLSSSEKMLEASNNELTKTYEETKNCYKKRTEDINGSFCVLSARFVWGF